MRARGVVIGLAALAWAAPVRGDDAALRGAAPVGGEGAVGGAAAVGGEAAIDGARAAGPALVCVQPIGPHDRWAVPVIRRGIEHVYGLPTEALPAVPLPKAAWYPPRQRWRADRILDALQASRAPRCTAVVAVTAVDISTTRDDAHLDWGVLGLAYLNDHVAVVSSFRARRGVGRAAIARRLVKVANHELGHVFGLPHGGAPGCIMNDAGGTVRTVDRERGTLCDDERAAVEAALGVTLPARAEIDWRAVIDGP